MGETKNFKGANGIKMVKGSDGKIVDNIAGAPKPSTVNVVVNGVDLSGAYIQAVAADGTPWQDRAEKLGINADDVLAATEKTSIEVYLDRNYDCLDISSVAEHAYLWEMESLRYTVEDSWTALYRDEAVGVDEVTDEIVKELGIDLNAWRVVFDAVWENVSVNVPEKALSTTFKHGHGLFGANPDSRYRVSGDYSKQDALKMLAETFYTGDGQVYPDNLAELNTLSVLCESDTGWVFPLNADTNEARLVISFAIAREIQDKLAANEIPGLDEELYYNVATGRIKISTPEGNRVATFDDLGLSSQLLS